VQKEDRWNKKIVGKVWVAMPVYGYFTWDISFARIPKTLLYYGATLFTLESKNI